MNRDIRFEIQYLLTLTLVVFGLLSIEDLHPIIDRRVGYLVVLLVSLHLALFNLYYGYGEALSYSIDFVERMHSRSRYILYLTAMSFVYLIIHWLFSAVHQYLLAEYLPDYWKWEIFIDYAAPILIIGIMGFYFRENVSDPRERFRDIQIKIFPQEVRVFPSTRDSKPFTVKIENDSEQPFEYDLEINAPTLITLHSDGEEYSNVFTAHGRLNPGRADRRTFELSHSAPERILDVIEVIVRFEGGQKAEEVEADLVA